LIWQKKERGLDYFLFLNSCIPSIVVTYWKPASISFMTSLAVVAPVHNYVGFECGLEEDSEMGREKGEETVRRAFLLQLSRETSKARQAIKGFFKIQPDFRHNPRSTVEGFCQVF
jgi:hypothetical protein